MLLVVNGGELFDQRLTSQIFKKLDLTDLHTPTKNRKYYMHVNVSIMSSISLMTSTLEHELQNLIANNRHRWTIDTSMYEMAGLLMINKERELWKIL